MSKETKGKTEFTFGNFLVEIVLNADLIASLEENASTDVVPYILDGCTQKLQRKPAGAVEKALAGYKKVRSEMGKDWKRSDIPFSKEGVAMLEVEMGSAVQDVAEVSVTEYVGGETSEAKYGYERAQLKTALSGGKTLESIAKKADYDGELLDEDGYGGYSVEFLLAVRELLKGALS